MRSLRLLRLANPVVRGILSSRVHPLLSRTLVVLAYRGHRSGRAFRIPLRYAEATDGRIVALAARPDEKLWWRSFAVPAAAELTLRGEHVDAEGAVAEAAKRVEAEAAYVARYPRSVGVARNAVFVVFTPRSR